MAVSAWGDNADKKFPVAMFGLILLNCLVFFCWELPQGRHQLQANLFRFGLVPYDYVSGSGGIPPWYTLVTMMFIHGGYLHLFGNMLFLWIFGERVEEAFGHWKFLGFFLLCGIGGNLVYILFNQDSWIPSVGASGAISGVMAAYVLLFPKQEVRLLSLNGFISVSGVAVVGVWMTLQILSTVAMMTSDIHSGIAYMAHLGGFAMGLCLTPLLRHLPKRLYHLHFRGWH